MGGSQYGGSAGVTSVVAKVENKPAPAKKPMGPTGAAPKSGGMQLKKANTKKDSFLTALSKEEPLVLERLHSFLIP